MKTQVLFLSLLLVLFSFSCEDDDDFSRGPDADLVGTWELVEVLADPGNGSGTFQPVDSDRSILFAADGTFIASGDICQFSILADSTSVGIYDEVTNTIIPEDCVTIGGTPLRYEIEGRQMIISYLCFEGCQHKYRKQ